MQFFLISAKTHRSALLVAPSVVRLSVRPSVPALLCRKGLCWAMGAGPALVPRGNKNTLNKYQPPGSCLCLLVLVLQPAVRGGVGWGGGGRGGHHFFLKAPNLGNARNSEPIPNYPCMKQRPAVLRSFGGIKAPDAQTAPGCSAAHPLPAKGQGAI